MTTEERTGRLGVAATLTLLVGPLLSMVDSNVAIPDIAGIALFLRPAAISPEGAALDGAGGPAPAVPPEAALRTAEPAG